MMVWFTKLTVLFFLECGWVGGVCWVVVVRGMRNFRVRTLASQFGLLRGTFLLAILFQTFQ